MKAQTRQSSLPGCRAVVAVARALHLALHLARHRRCLQPGGAVPRRAARRRRAPFHYPCLLKYSVMFSNDLGKLHRTEHGRLTDEKGEDKPGHRGKMLPMAGSEDGPWAGEAHGRLYLSLREKTPTSAAQRRLEPHEAPVNNPSADAPARAGERAGRGAPREACPRAPRPPAPRPSPARQVPPPAAPGPAPRRPRPSPAPLTCSGHRGPREAPPAPAPAAPSPREPAATAAAAKDNPGPAGPPRRGGVSARAAGPAPPPRRHSPALRPPAAGRGRGRRGPGAGPAAAALQQAPADRLP
ncbi:uncharacterized protein [Dasypus novemcinctus]|uniref:uncharacterized protein n=1 Tax=Dasypus novemcinctus TaxID=9361 RepID=UPI0039C9A192